MGRRHSIKVRKRAFSIWQKAGYNPWERPIAARKKSSGDFYKGAFDSIPFLNDDAKRTFTHLLLRPGYMIRDYLHGAHDRYLAPLTALIIFYAFFALVSSALQPVQHQSEMTSGIVESLRESANIESGMIKNVGTVVLKGYLYLHLDQYPEEVDTRWKTAMAALEGNLRSQGVPLFIGEFFLWWLAIGISLRRYRLGMSAAAAISAYLLCQFCFFMLFAVMATWGESKSIGLFLILILLTVDFSQILDISKRKSFGLALKTGFFYGLVSLSFILILSILVLLIASLL